MTQRPFQADPVLTAIAIGYMNPQASYIADIVLPRSDVGGETFKYSTYPLAEAFNVPDSRVGRRGQVQQVEFSGDQAEATVEDFGLDTPIVVSDIEAARAARAAGTSNFDPEAHSVMMLTDTVINCREVRVAQKIFNAGTYAAGRKTLLAGNTQFSDYVNSDPIGVINAGADATLVFRPNLGIMGRQVWSKLKSHPKIVNAVKGNVTNQGNVTLEQFTELFASEGIQRWVIGDTWYNTAKPGQAPVLTRAWGKHISLIHQNPIASVQGGGVTFGLTAQFGGKIAGRIEDPDIGLQGGYRVRSGERIKELILAQDVGYFIENAVA